MKFEDALDILDKLLLYVLKKSELTFKSFSGLVSFAISYIGYLYCGLWSWLIFTFFVWPLVIYTCGEWFEHYSSVHSKIRCGAIAIATLIVTWVIFIWINADIDYLGDDSWKLPFLYVLGSVYAFGAGYYFNMFKRFLKRGEKQNIAPLKYIYLVKSKKIYMMNREKGGQ